MIVSRLGLGWIGWATLWAYFQTTQQRRPVTRHTHPTPVHTNQHHHQQESNTNGGVARRHALGQALGKLALVVGAGSWAGALGSVVAPAAAETTAVKKVCDSIEDG